MTYYHQFDLRGICVHCGVTYKDAIMAQQPIACWRKTYLVDAPDTEEEAQS
jgi:hypothetical protein